MNENSMVPARATLEGRATGLDEELTLWRYGSLLLRRRRMILLLPLASAIVVGTMSLMSSRQYSAAASFVPQEAPAVQTGLSELASQFGLSAARRGIETPQFYADLLESREVLRAVVAGPYSAPGESGFTGNLISYFEITEPDPDQGNMVAMKRLRKLMSVKADRITGIVRMSVHTGIPELSVQIVARFLELMNDYNMRRRQSRGRAERVFVEERVDTAQRALDEAEERLEAFARNNRRTADSPELLAEQARLQRRVSLTQQIYLSLAQSYEAAKIEEVRNTPVITVLERPEGFVGPQPRGTVRKTLAALLVGLVLAVGVALGGEVTSRARQRAAADYNEFVSLRSQVWTNLKSMLRVGPTA